MTDSLESRRRKQSRKLVWDRKLTRELFVRYHQDGDESARDQLVEMYLKRIEAYDQKGPKLNAVIYVNPKALEEAAALDAPLIAPRSSRSRPLMRRPSAGLRRSPDRSASRRGWCGSAS